MPAADAGWIAEHRRPFGEYVVGSLVPVVFEAYARILHPAWGSRWKDARVRWETVAAWSERTMHPLAQWESVAAPVTTAHGAPPFAAPPDRDGLDPQGLEALFGVLTAHTTTPGDCFIGVWDGYGWPVEAWAGPEVLDLEQRSYLIRRGPLTLARDLGWSSDEGTRSAEPPSLIWPADRAWFVASDPDLDFTCVGGSAMLVQALRAESLLEVWPVGVADRIAFDSDRINV